MIDPKKDFQDKAESVKRWNEIIDSRLMQDACLAAWAEFNLGLPSPVELATAAANDWRRQGAKQFMQVLLELTYRPAAPPRRGGQNLDHTA